MNHQHTGSFLIKLKNTEQGKHHTIKHIRLHLTKDCYVTLNNLTREEYDYPVEMYPLEKLEGSEIILDIGFVLLSTEELTLLRNYLLNLTNNKRESFELLLEEHENYSISSSIRDSEYAVAEREVIKSLITAG